MAQHDLESLDEIQDMTYNMMVVFNDGLNWLVDYCRKNNLPYPDLNKAVSLISTSGYLLEHSEFTHRKTTGTRNNQQDNSTFKIKHYILGYLIVR